MDQVPGADAVTGIEADVRRVGDRLRSLSQARLAAACGPYPSAADAGRAAARTLVDACAAVEGAPARRLPRLTDFAVADQVAVAGHDLVAALRSRAASGVDLDAVAAELAAVRRLL